MAGWLPRLFSSALPRVKPYSEMGVSGTPVYAGYVLTPERSPKLVGQEKYRTYAEILANTSIVAAGVRYFLNIVAKPSWNVEPADDSAEAKQMAEFVEDVIDDLHTPWARIVRRSGTYRFQGFSIQEWTAEKRDDGKIGLHDIESRPQWTIWRWEVDERGSVIGAWQRDPLTGRELGLPRGKIMYLVDDTLTDSPEGMGLLRHCVEPAQRLEEYLKQEGYGFLRDLHGVPLGRAPVDELTNAVAQGKITQAQMDGALAKLREFVSMEKKTTDTSIILNSQPYVDYTDSGNTVSSQMKWGVELISGAAPGLRFVGESIVRINTEIARILGVEHLLLGADAAGSYALAKEKATDLYLLANSVLSDVAYQAQHDVVWPLWSLNGFKEELKPKLKPADVSPKDVEQIGRVLRDMATAGAALQPDDEVQNFVRDLLGAPQLDIKKLQERLAEIQTDPAQNPALGREARFEAGGGKAKDKAKDKAKEAAQQDQQDKKDARRSGAIQKALFAKGLVDGFLAKGANGAQEKLVKIADGLDDILMKAYDPEEQRDQRGRWSPSRGISHIKESSGRSAEWVKEQGGAVLDKAVEKLKDPETAKTALSVAISAGLSAIGKMDQGNIQDMAVKSEVENFATNAQVTVGRAKEIMTSTVDALLKRRKKKKMEKDKDEIADFKKLEGILDRFDEIAADLEKLTEVLDRLDIKKMVPYAEAKPYMQEDAYIAGRAGASDGPMRADPYFSERGSIRPSGPDQRGMKDPKRRKLRVADMSTVQRPTPRAGHRFDGEAIVSGDDMVPGSRMKTSGRQRTL